MTQRINDPKSISREEIDKIISDGKNPIIQFSEYSYSTPLLKEVNELCVIYGEELEIRFYGHYGDKFDAKILYHLPDVQNLSVDCLQYIENHEELGKLQKLKSLSFGVYYFQDKDFLSKLNLKGLNRLVIGDNHKNNINLSYLSECKILENLHVVGHTKNIDVVGLLPKLKQLSLGSIGKKQSLLFVNEIRTLESLMVILGGRQSLVEINNENLKKIEIIRVRGLEVLGDLSRFPNLSHLHIEDQIKIKEVAFSNPLLSLNDLKVLTCKTLNTIIGLNNLLNLSNLRIYNTLIEINEVLNSNLPESLNVFAFYTGKVKKDKEIRTLLDSRGFKEFN
jgi:hypothetical protein